MIESNNKVLKRQLKKLKITDFESLDEKKFNSLLSFIEETYNDMDENVYRLERALDISTTELREFNDNLEIKIKDELLKNREKDEKILAQSRFASMGEMIGNIAHQWRQPLSAISSTSSSMLIQMELDLSSKDDIADSYKKILEYTEFLSTTIDDFRNFLRDSDEKSEFNIADVILKTLSIVSSTYMNHNININFSSQFSNLQIKAIGIPSKLSQVFLNIFNNAKDASITKLDEKSRNIYISYESEGLNHVITIHDNAQGIPEEIKDKIFDPYFTTKHQSQGTGIGLYMSRKIVESMDGTLDVINKEAIYNNKSYNGACFIIKLPKI